MPNWFYYWKQEVSNKLKIKSIPLYDKDAGVWNNNPPDLIFDLEYRDYGKYKWNPDLGKQVSMGSNLYRFGITKEEYPSGSGIWYGTNFISNPKIAIGEGCGYWNKEKDYIDGIMAFINTLSHELHHTKLFFEMYPNGYINTLDKDNDYYKDEDETKYNSEHPDRIQFIIGAKEEFTNDYSHDKYEAGTEVPAVMFEEDKCRAVEEVGMTEYNDKDWSYDPDNKAEGKNWKKK